MPIVNEVVQDNEIEVVYYLNVEKYNEGSAKYFEKYQIQGVPEIIKFENGEEVAKSFEYYAPEQGDETEDAYERMYKNFFKETK